MESLLTIRPATLADAAAIAHVHVIGWQTTYRDIIPTSYIDTLTVTRRTALWEKQLQQATESSYGAFVACDYDATVVGFVDGGPIRRKELQGIDSELYALYIIPDKQKLGLGRRLVIQMATHLYQHGLISMALWVIDKNPARRFYEHLGGQYMTEITDEIDGVTLREIALGWSDIRILLK